MTAKVVADPEPPILVELDILEPGPKIAAKLVPLLEEFFL